jgi:hypothetical protein
MVSAERWFGTHCGAYGRDIDERMWRAPFGATRECQLWLLDRILGGDAERVEKQSGGFATYRVDHDYELFEELSRKVPA